MANKPESERDKSLIVREHIGQALRDSQNAEEMVREAEAKVRKLKYDLKAIESRSQRRQESIASSRDEIAAAIDSSSGSYGSARADDFNS